MYVLMLNRELNPYSINLSQGCGLRKKLAQRFLTKKSWVPSTCFKIVTFSSNPKVKVSHLWYLGMSRAQSVSLHGKCHLSLKQYTKLLKELKRQTWMQMLSLYVQLQQMHHSLNYLLLSFIQILS